MIRDRGLIFVNYYSSNLYPRLVLAVLFYMEGGALVYSRPERDKAWALMFY
jgi:hypothetical protein